MEGEQTTYQSPLSLRYASEVMKRIFSPQNKHSIWRRLWVALARGEQSLGLSITREQINELAAHQDTIDFELVAQYEKKLRHDVMAHLHAYGDQCPKAKGIIHLGATSAYVTDNGDLIQMREGLLVIQGKLIQLIRVLSGFAEKHAGLACLGYTHFQAAQLTTVGKRACLWLQEFMLDMHDLAYRLDTLRFLGLKGATGTQASFLELFKGDHSKVKALESAISQELGFTQCFSIAGQTYTRKQDIQLVDLLVGIAVSAHKMATDMRLLAHLKEIEEPFRSEQVGSSAMPYKRNPMGAERICSIARFVISLGENPKYTAALQWLERTLDDSANRRLCIPEAFLGCDALLNLCIDLISGAIVYPKMIQKHLAEELPFIATENILMQCVKKGGDRQKIHELIRQHSQQAGQRVKEGEANDLLDRLARDPSIGITHEELAAALEANAFVGRAPEQVREFLNTEVKPLLENYKGTPEYFISVDV